MPSRRTILFVAVSWLLVAVGTLEIERHVRPPFVAAAPGPPQPVDATFVVVGRDYLAGMGKVYATAWEEGAKSLESGAGMEPALQAVAAYWASGKGDLYDQVLAPKFSAIVPESTRDADVTPAERTAMAAAWRGLAQGLRP